MIDTTLKIGELFITAIGVFEIYFCPCNHYSCANNELEAELAPPIAIILSFAVLNYN